ncbi:uncharacterized protein G2W53_021908 [Senna tora]|uniref:Uncharacterized protein n=1 Tax=Senna tora TaxID=362788 RepID=A0A834TM35_9FABA|nr:uncharacterized protein G2W53_021908 [Senna tora]
MARLHRRLVLSCCGDFRCDSSSSLRLPSGGVRWTLPICIRSRVTSLPKRVMHVRVTQSSRMASILPLFANDPYHY